MTCYRAGDRVKIVRLDPPIGMMEEYLGTYGTVREVDFGLVYVELDARQGRPVFFRFHELEAL